MEPVCSVIPSAKDEDHEADEKKCIAGASEVVTEKAED